MYFNVLSAISIIGDCPEKKMLALVTAVQLSLLFHVGATNGGTIVIIIIIIITITDSNQKHIENDWLSIQATKIISIIMLSYTIIGIHQLPLPSIPDKTTYCIYFR